MSKEESKLCAVIMAGGKGTRFWPLSTEEKPKQFLNLLGNDTMIQMTVKRLLPLIPMERIFVVTGKQYVKYVREQLPNLDERNIIVEPMGRNTAPCIGLATFYIDKIYKNSTLVVLPSDHLIQDDNKFIDDISLGANFVNNKEEAIVTIGIKPDRPETGYGYIKYRQCDYEEGLKIREVERFVEKPNIDRAKEYIDDGGYLWNAGMFIWKTDNVLNLFNKYLNNTYTILHKIFSCDENEYEQSLEKNYLYVDNISIDFGIMEKTRHIFVIPAYFKWDDVGSWSALERYRERDTNNNTLVGNVKNIDGKNNIVVGNGKPIIISGLDDVILVENNDVIFIGKKGNIKETQKLCEALEF